MKFSIVVPVYNVEKYIDKCLKSIENQCYKDFEVIIVNDGSLDHSEDIIEKYVSRDERFNCYKKENGGLSDARNYGLQYAQGEYLLFLDSDDYFEPLLLEKISNEILKCKKVDLIRFDIRMVDEDGKILGKTDYHHFSNIPMNYAVKEILDTNMVEPAWSYVYNMEFFKSNKFSYPVGKLHEDFGLTPYILVKAKNISSLDYVGLNYVQRSGSIMNTKDIEKDRKKVIDCFYHYEYLRKQITNLEIDYLSKERIMNFVVRILYEKIADLDNKEVKREMIALLKETDAVCYLPNKTLKQKVKKIVAKVNYSLYFDLFYK